VGSTPAQASDRLAGRAAVVRENLRRDDHDDEQTGGMTDDWQPGYPIDLRTPEQRVKASTNHVSPDFELAVVLIYLSLIALLSLTAVYAKKSARRRAAAEMVRILWVTRGRQDGSDSGA
jgi:hypothetical protein